MRDLIEKAVAGVDVIIHLGAGKCSELPAYLDANRSARVVLAEANPSLANALIAKTADTDRVAVLPLAVSAQAGSHTLHVYSLPNFSSLRRATLLHDYYPGLRLMQEIPVEAHLPQEVFEQADVGSEQRVCLVLDTPGEQLSILAAVASAGLLQRCVSLVVNCSRDAVYQAAPSERDILAMLEQQGYDVVAKDDADPDQPTWVFKLNVHKLENRKLVAELADARAALESEQKQRKELINEIGRIEAEARREKEHLSALVDQLQERVEQAAVHADDYRADLQVEQDEVIKKLKALDVKRSERLQQMCDEHKQEVERLQAEHRQKLEEAEQDRSRLLGDEGKTNSMKQLQEQLEEAAAAVEEKDRELREAKRDLGVALRLQALREADLKDLQSRYASIQDVKQQQHELLLKLRQRLGFAADRLKELSVDDHRSAAVSAQDIVRALSDSESD